MSILNKQLTTTQLDFFEVSSGETQAVTNVLVCNSFSPSATGAENHNATFDMYIVKNGDSVSDKNVVVKEITLPAGETYSFDTERVVLDEGDKIVFTASPDQGNGVTDLSATLSYMKV